MSRAVRVAAIVCGVGISAYGAVGLVGSTDLHALRSAATWFVGGNLVHDALIAPATLLVGAVVARLSPAVVRAYLQAALIISAGVVLITLPLLSGRGYDARNPSALPLNYPRGLAVTLIGVWLVVGIIAAGRITLSHRRSGR